MLRALPCWLPRSLLAWDQGRPEISACAGLAPIGGRDLPGHRHEGVEAAHLSIATRDGDCVLAFLRVEDIVKPPQQRRDGPGIAVDRHFFAPPVGNNT